MITSRSPGSSVDLALPALCTWQLPATMSVFLCLNAFAINAAASVRVGFTITVNLLGSCNVFQPIVLEGAVYT